MLRRQASLSRPDDPERQRWRRELSLFAGQADLDEAMGPTREALLELKTQVERRDDRLLVAVAPPAFQHLGR